jgi:hypothetical protein
MKEAHEEKDRFWDGVLALMACTGIVLMGWGFLVAPAAEKERYGNASSYSETSPVSAQLNPQRTRGSRHH